ncbi:winged helix-turn-helix transcriptional regulator [Amantichitinum ursilacus]|uniref:HTH-type transcriptional regulator YodB n=1 Tax=Amantichitinum ursilacus TaxID=857265 RepID=A0A0N0GPZ9_9NEIS|nr:helix-turn-helix domain-containing protein [Amantichitinum ursilacus]KPC54165.1 HTH-type transcriptional regulator YodB [Amantichitinum ursilacus]
MPAADDVQAHAEAPIDAPIDAHLEAPIDAHLEAPIDAHTEAHIEADCTANAARLALEQVTNKWSVLILTVVCTQPSRFNEIKRRLDPITHKALTEALRRLERNGLITRTVLPTSPVGVEYAITPLARTLQEPFMALVSWSQQHGEKIGNAQAAYDARTG